MESGIQLKDCGIPIRLGSGIQVALSCRNLESRIWKPEYTVWNPESKTEKTDDISRRYHWFPRERTSEKKRRNSILMTCHYQDLGSASDWLRQILRAARPIRNTTQIWVLTRHQCGISVLVSQTSFREETVGGVAKCRLFSQATRIQDCLRLTHLERRNETSGHNRYILKLAIMLKMIM